jgi:hypothetical protein
MGRHHPKEAPVKKLLAPTSSTISLAILSAAAVALAAGCGGGGARKVVRTVTVQQAAVARTVAVQHKAAALSATGDQRLYGQVKSLERKGDHYELRFDPAFFLSGVAANVAQAEDQHTPCQPSACPPVANDNYVVDESHRLLTYLVPADVQGTVLTKSGSSGGPFPATTITVAQLAQIIAGKSSLKLFEPLSSGVWILVHVDTVRTFAQQYRP